MRTADEHFLQLALDHNLVPRECLPTVRAKLNAGCDPAVAAAVLDELLRDGALNEDALLRVAAHVHELPLVEPASLAIEATALTALPRTWVEGNLVLPHAWRNGRLAVVVANPLAMDLIDDACHLAGAPVEMGLASRAGLRRAIARAFGTGENDSVSTTTTPFAETMTAPDPEPAGASLAEDSVADAAATAPINQLVQRLVGEAITRRASDIHFEPLAKKFRVRFRIDGSLVEVDSPPKRLQLAIVSRLKIMANISIAEKRLPQDGRMQLDVAGRRLDLRVSSLPTVHGESVVLRVLDPEGLKLGLPELGFWPDDQQQFERLINAPDGMVLVTGPTGSGKTTTLYACLHQLNQQARKIITVEEPVEYQISGVNQVPVNSAIGMTFSAALRAMLRQAPNVVMIGEIRDRETAEIAINAALTGHLVFSTLHTNDAPSAVTRLLDIGVRPFLVAGALRAAVAQRLVRRNCPACAQSHLPTEAELNVASLARVDLGRARFRRGMGCAECQGTGYRGRIGIFETFLINDEIRALICSEPSASRLRQMLRAGGFRTLRDDGIRKVLAGQTTIAEVIAATVGDEL